MQKNLKNESLVTYELQEQVSATHIKRHCVLPGYYRVLSPEPNPIFYQYTPEKNAFFAPEKMDYLMKKLPNELKRGPDIWVVSKGLEPCHGLFFLRNQALVYLDLLSETGSLIDGKIEMEGLLENGNKVEAAGTVFKVKKLISKQF